MATIEEIINGESGLITRGKLNDNFTNLNADKLETSLKGVPNGLAELGSGGQVPITQIPAGVATLKGEWDAATNSPSLADGVGSAGDTYDVTTGGTQDLGSGNITFDVGDQARYNGALWYKLDNTDAVNSVHSRTGAVVSQNGDYTASQITNVAAGSISSTTVQAAIDELDSEKEPLFSKNTAFNKNFGSSAGDVAEGNDTRLSDSRTCNNNFDDPTTAKTNLALVKGDVGLGNVSNIDTTTTANITDSSNKRFVTDANLTKIANALVSGDIGSSVQAYDADTAKTNVAQEFTKQQNFNASTLTDAVNIAWDLDDNQVTSVILTNNRTLDNPTNMKDGATYILTIKQDITGSRTIGFGSAYKFPAGLTPVLSTGSNAVDIISFISDGTNMYGIAQYNFS